MKNIFKVLSAATLATAIMLPTFSVTTKANTELTEINPLELEQLQKKHNLEPATTIPNGAVPPIFHSAEEADTYLSGFATSFATTQVANLTGSFRATSAANLNVTVGYEVINGRINLVSVSSQAIGDGAFSFQQSSYTTQRLDSGRSMGITVQGVLTRTVVVGGKIQKSYYNESVYVEI